MKNEIKWPINWVSAAISLRHAQIHIAEQNPKCIAWDSSEPDRQAVILLASVEQIVRICQSK